MSLYCSAYTRQSLVKIKGVSDFCSQKIAKEGENLRMGAIARMVILNLGTAKTVMTVILNQETGVTKFAESKNVVMELSKLGNNAMMEIPKMVIAVLQTANLNVGTDLSTALNNVRI